MKIELKIFRRRCRDTLTAFADCRSNNGNYIGSDNFIFCTACYNCN